MTLPGLFVYRAMGVVFGLHLFMSTLQKGFLYLTFDFDFS